ncbi:TPA: hypothetical protein DCR85_02095 [Candidatus Moranbacteria bacterium]|nr:hypothetical protein [Candidatus Moranbacteria bacterium]
MLKIVFFLFVSFSALTAWGWKSPPSEGDEEVLAQETAQNVILTKASIYDNVWYKYANSKDGGGCFTDLTAIYTPDPDSDLREIIRKKIPVDIDYRKTRIYTGRYWSYESVVEINWATKKHPIKKRY